MVKINEELDKQCKIIDMMLSAHSRLRDQYSFRSCFMDLVVFCSSLVLIAFLFLDPLILQYLSISQDLTRLVIGTSTIIISILSFVSLRVDWKQKGEQYRQTAEALAKLKNDCYNLNFEIDESTVRAKKHRITTTINQLPVKIPENQFLMLKAFHKRKIELSKAIDQNPGASINVLRLCILLKSNCNAFKINKTK